jgi:SNF2 family DNA or RNA helicase
MQIVNNKDLLLQLRDPTKVTSQIPKSKDIGNNQVLVNWGLDEARTLRQLNIRNVPSPILGHYKWPGMHKPFSHQKTTASFLTLNQKALCLNEQGTGKTASVIWAADWLMEIGQINRVLVICPLSIMDSAWRADLFKFAMHRTVDIAYGSVDKRRAIINGDAEFVIINYDGVEVVEKEIDNGGFDLIVVDEANAYKNTTTKRWKCLNRLVGPRTWLWMLTGTPAAQSPVDAYGLAKLINPTAVPRFASTFKEMVLLKISQFRWIPKIEATQIVHRVLQPAIRFSKEDCLDLPEMTYVRRTVDMTPQQKKYYKLLKDKLIVKAGGEQITAVNAAVAMSKLLQVACGAVYTDNGEIIEFDIKNRYAVLKEVIDESSQKVLVFVPFKHAINLISEKLTADRISNEIIQGDVSVNKRTDIFKRFQETPEPKVLIIQPQSAAHGVTLTAANTVVWWGPTASLETYAQANARVHRAGQRHPSTVVQLAGAPVEHHVYKLLDNKIDVHAKIIDLYDDLLA